MQQKKPFQMPPEKQGVWNQIPSSEEEWTEKAIDKAPTHRKDATLRDEVSKVISPWIGHFRAQYHQLRQTAMDYTEVAAELTQQYYDKLLEWLVPEYEELTNEASHQLNNAENTALELARDVAEASEEILMQVEGAIERLPIKSISKDGALQTKEGRNFLAIDLTGYPPEFLRKVVGQLHELGMDEAYKLTYEVSISGSTLDAHLEFLKQQVDQHGPVAWKKFSPKAMLPFETLHKMYLSLCEKVRKRHKVIRPLLVINEDAFEKLLYKLKGDNEVRQALSYTRITTQELTVYLLGLFQNLSRSNTKPYRVYKVKESEQGTLGATVPDELHFFDTWARGTTKPLWSEGEEEETKPTTTWYASLTLHLPEGLSTVLKKEATLKDLILPHVTSESRKVYLSQIARPAPKDGKPAKRYRTYARRKMLRFTRADNLDKDELEEALFKFDDNYDRARLEVLDKMRGRYYGGVVRNIKMIEGHNRRPFLVSPVTVVLESISKEDLESFLYDFEETLVNEDIWFEIPDTWREHETNFHKILPVITDWEADEDNLVTLPQWDYAIVSDVFYDSVPIPPSSIVFGLLKKDGMPLGTELAILAGQGAHGAGKSFLGKILAMFIRLFNPWRRVIVVDNTGAAELAGATKETFVDQAKQKGWVDIAAAHGGDVLYAIEYETPEEWLEALLEMEKSGSRFIVIYPDRSKHAREKDIVMLNWLLGALRRFQRSDLYGEREIQQALIVEDALAWNADVEGADGLPSRMKLFTQDVFNQCISSGTLLYASAQAAEAIAKSDPAAHAITKDTVIAWFNFVTSGHGTSPEAIGMTDFTPEGAALKQRTHEAMERQAPATIGVPENPGDCVVTIRNVVSEEAEILIPSDDIRTPDGQTFKQLLSRKKA